MKNYLNELVESLKAGYVPAFFLYDTIGSELYRQRVSQPDYYLYDLERQAISNCARYYQGDKLLDIGSGVTDKMNPIKKHYREYWALDIDEESASAASDNYIVSDFLNFKNTENYDCFFMGSTVSNLRIKDIHQLIKNCGKITIAADFAKDDVDKMIRAYTDPKGIGEAMEKRGLININNWYGTDFPVNKMTYECIWNPVTFIVETNLVFQSPHTIKLDNNIFNYEAGDKIRIGRLRKFMKHQWEWIFSQVGKVENIYTDDGDEYGIFRISSS